MKHELTHYPNESIEVTLLPGCAVIIELEDTFGNEAGVSLSPDEARRLAADLTLVADEMEA